VTRKVRKLDIQKVRSAARQWKKNLATREETIEALMDAGLSQMAAINQFDSWRGDGRVRQKQRLRLRRAREGYGGPMRGR